MSHKKDLILVTVSGKDCPGITSTLMEILSKGQCEILDIGQSVTRGQLSLSILLDFEGEIGNNMTSDPSSAVLKDLLFAAKNLNQTLDFRIIEDFEVAADLKEKENFIISCVAPNKIGADFLHALACKLAHQKINIYRIDNLSKNELSAIDLTTKAPADLDWEDLKGQLIQISDQYKVDIAFLKNNVFRYNKRLIAFDMDSTLIQTEVINEMAKAAGVGDQVTAITERAMNGEINFEESLIQRVRLLKGLKREELETIRKQLPLTSGVEDFVKTVKPLGLKLAIISGGFDFFSHHLKQQLGMDFAFSNQLEFKENCLTGELVGTLVGPEQKAFYLDFLAQQEGISLEQVVAVGDGANDLPMLAKAGMGIAFHAKDIVKKKAETAMAHGPMTSILSFLGIPSDQVFSSN